jgi:hypothetical protein
MKRVGIAIAALSLLIALPVSGQEPEGSPEFERALYRLLQTEDWTPGDIQSLVKDEADWGRARFRDAELITACLGYAKDTDEEIGPREQLQLALTVKTLAQEMRKLGFAEQQMVRTALNGTRDALGELTKLQDRERIRSAGDGGTGELIRSRFQEQLHTAMHLDARNMVQTRVRAEQDSRPGDLLVPPGPQGPGGPGR